MNQNSYNLACIMTLLLAETISLRYESEYCKLATLVGVMTSLFKL